MVAKEAFKCYKIYKVKTALFTKSLKEMHFIVYTFGGLGYGFGINFHIFHFNTRPFSRSSVSECYMLAFWQSTKSRL